MSYAKKLRNFSRTIAFRLTATYLLLFALASAVAFLIFYIVVVNDVRRKRDQSLLNTAEEMRSLFESRGLEALKEELIREAKATGTEQVVYRLVSRGGKILAASDVSPWTEVSPDRDEIQIALAGNPVLKTIQISESRHHHRKVRLLYTPLGGGTVLQLGLSLRSEAQLLERFREVFSTTILIVLTIAGLSGWFLVNRMLRRVADVTGVARKISTGSLESRVPLAGTGDELDQLASTFNEMLDHIQTLVTEMQEVTDNIAHDLRNPITRLRGNAEVTLMQGRTPQEYRESLAETIAECDHLLSLINLMLDISEAEAGMMRLNLEQVHLTNVVEEAAEMYRPAAEEKDVTLEISSACQAWILADPQRLTQAVVNLVDNALKYTPSGGRIILSVEVDNGMATLSVCDTGNGIAAEEIPRIFRRFYRSRSSDGFGLGLSMVQAIVRAHHGTIQVESSPGQGSTFHMTIPL